MSDKTIRYTLYLNGNLYGVSSSSEYMTELIRDYVEFCDMYGKDSVVFEVRRERIVNH